MLAVGRGFVAPVGPVRAALSVTGQGPIGRAGGNGAPMAPAEQGLDLDAPRAFIQTGCLRPDCPHSRSAAKPGHWRAGAPCAGLAGGMEEGTP